ncbi:MAG: glycosyltransferase family 2 protein [Planctomycetes bacterium]|nr:glycosyltransferase family 2 protein [Planctomycetota bacterium]
MIRVFVSCFNYGRFLEDCLRSVARQTQSDFHCTVVDDGSSDHSLAIASVFCDEDKRFEAITQKNAGQLSVFNRACTSVSADDLVFFLDADDLWADDHLSSVLEAANDSFVNSDFVFTNHLNFSSGIDSLDLSQHPRLPVRVLGITSGVTRAFQCWIGNVTSSLCLRGRLLHRILPYPFENEWRVRADDVLVLGASICGARKCYLQSNSVYYRVHENNSHYGKKATNPSGTASHVIARERYLNWLCSREHLDRVPSPFLVSCEMEAMSEWDKCNYSRIRLKSIMCQPWPLVHRMKLAIRLLKNNLRGD